VNLGQFAIPRKAEIPVGAVGVWQIPSIDVSIPLYQATNATQQSVVDAEDSAMITRYGAGRIIVDHADSKAGSGKWELWRVSLKDAGFLILPNKTLTYECVQLCIVDVQRTCYTFDGSSIYPRRATDILCFSCVGSDSKHNYMAYFKQIGEIPA
jgi:hypothetical protein